MLNNQIHPAFQKLQIHPRQQETFERKAGATALAALVQSPSLLLSVKVCWSHVGD
jgi:hypothetical protein